MFAFIKIRPFSYKQKRPFLRIFARVKLSDGLLDWRELEKPCEIVRGRQKKKFFLHSPQTLESFFCWKRKQFWKKNWCSHAIAEKKTAEPNRKLIFLLLQQVHVPCNDDAQPKTQVSAGARCSLPWNPWWLAHAGARATAKNEKWRGRSVHTWQVHIHWALLFEVCTPVLRLDVRFGVLALASSVEFRLKMVETVTSWHLWLDNTTGL